jgi:hypothetical protein
MSTITFDTQELVRELRTSGIPQEQVEAVVRTIVTAHEGLSTKNDLAMLEAKLDGKFSVIDVKFGKVQWMLGIVIALAVANFAKYFF